jgi:tetratricopeptide (TPR) repeat protein
MLNQHLRLAAPWTTPAAALTLLLAIPAFAQDEHAHHVLGTVHFPVTCSTEAQAAFDEGMKLQHSFWHKAAIAKFQEALERDPSCAMAHWGQALAIIGNPFAVPSAKNLAEGLDHLEEAQRIGAKTEREAGWIEALLTFFRDHDKQDHRTRVMAFERAMGDLAARFPDDPEARIYHALSLTVSAAPTDKTYARQLRAAEILEAEWRRQPEHPGVAHYLIHTYDVPPLAEKGLAAAGRYATIAPDAPHAVHMPSHIFTRVGYWPESIASNERSAAAAREIGSVGDEIHALDYVVYAHLQMGQDEAARRIVADLGRFGDIDPARVSLPIAAFYGTSAMPARLAMERGAWDEAATLETRKSPSPFLFADALTHYARAVGLARSGSPDKAASEIEALNALVKGLRDKKDAYWSEQVDIQRQVAEAWVAFARGDKEKALIDLRIATEREAATEKHAVTPGPLAPAREQLAEALLAMGRPGEALTEFEAVQRTEPNRFRAIYGAAHAAEMVGDRERARQHYGRLLEIVGAADTTRPEITTARTFVAEAR